MGVWGSGLYAGDFARDLRATIGAVTRLPFGGDELLEILAGTEPAANDPGDEQYTTFWLVVADQFAKRGIACHAARERAIGIIDAGSDLAMLAALGLSPGGLKSRKTMLLRLRAQLTQLVAPARSRAVLKRPQPFLMDVGDVLAYPTSGGRCVNPYFASKTQDRVTSAKGWEQDGWSAFVVVDRGRAFEFLAWYRPLTASVVTIRKPTVGELRDEAEWRLTPPGTCSRLHYRRMELEVIGRLPIDPDAVRRSFPVMRPGTNEAIDDVSLANSLNLRPTRSPVTSGQPPPTIDRIDRILAEAGPPPGETARPA